MQALVVRFAILLLLTLGVLITAAPLSTVTLDYGTFTGQTNTSTGIIYFRGLRFADPPVGDLRWRAPVSPPSKNLGHVDASTFGFSCIPTASNNSSPTTSEDCLFGNVYIPIDTTAKSKLPVLIFFHGGGFELGSSTTFPPENMIQGSTEPLIFVTFQYRLGQFGFLAGPEVENDGVLNAGLLDQRAALEWVQRYISKFGGDPEKVTIWGQSAGAASTMYHIIAEDGVNKHLFRRAMGDSSPMIFMAHNTDTFISNLFAQFTGLAGCGGNKNVMSCLRAASTETLALAGSTTLANRSSSLYPFGPIADGKFITTRPVEAFKSGKFIHVPVFYGSNTNEGANWSASLANSSANTSEPNASEDTVYNFLTGQWGGLTRASFDTAITKYYPIADYANFSLQGQQMYGEMRFICSALLITGAYHNAGVPSYDYHWDNPIIGSNHAAELAMFFDVGRVFDPVDEQLAVAMRQYWTSFATSDDGIPTARGAPAWTTSGRNGSPRLLLHPGQVGMEEVTDELIERCAFWHDLVSELDT